MFGMASNRNQFVIEKLNRRNFSRWFKDVRYLLIDHNCWEIINEKDPKPDDKNVEALANWKLRENLAMSTIYLSIEADLKYIIDSCSEPIKAWKLLHRHFRPDNRAQLMKSFSDFLQCRIEADEGVDMFSAKLTQLFEELSSYGHKISEVFKCLQLLRYLPEQFELIVQTILRWPETDFTYGKILNKLIAEESRLLLRERDRNNGVVPEIQLT